MNGDKIFLDTNIVVYAHDVSAGHKHEVSRNIMFELWEQRRGVLSTQVLQEFFHVATTKIIHPLNVQTAKEVMEFLLKWNMVVNDGNCVLDAIDIHQKHKYSFWDSLIVASARKGGSVLLLSEDFNDGQMIGELTIKNPFVSK